MGGRGHFWDRDQIGGQKSAEPSPATGRSNRPEDWSVQEIHEAGAVLRHPPWKTENGEWTRQGTPPPTTLPPLTSDPC